MLRDKNLAPLSRQHQHALALCVRLDRAMLTGDVDLAAWQKEIQQQFEQEISFHFTAEEKEVFPSALRFAELKPVVEELVAEHTALRALFSCASAGELDAAGLRQFVEKLSTHIRKEERQLFEGMQQRMTPEELAATGAALEQALAEASDACIIPTEATRLKPKQ